ncbi:MAG: hypothetical protein E4H09_00605, partial [Spirochaetales bacterium]
MGTPRRIVAATALTAVLFITTSCATIGEEEFLALTTEREQLVQENATLQQEIVVAGESEKARALENERLAEVVAAQKSRIEQLAESLASAETDLADARSARDQVPDETDRLNRQVTVLQAALEGATARAAAAEAAQAAAAREADTERTAAATEDTAATAAAEYLAAVLAGREGFRRIGRFGFVQDPQARDVTAPGVGIDTGGTEDILFDTRLNYTATGVYLTILEPDARSPVLQLVAQFATQRDPLWAQTAFIAIEGLDPVDPVDPIVLAEAPVRETDGDILMERFSIPVD